MCDDLPFQPSASPGDSWPAHDAASGPGDPPLPIGPERFTGHRRSAKPVYSVGEALRRAVAAPAFQSLGPRSVLLPERFRGRLLLRRRNALAGIAVSPDNGEQASSVWCRLRAVKPQKGERKGPLRRAAPGIDCAFVAHSIGPPSAASSRYPGLAGGYVPSGMDTPPSPCSPHTS